MQNNEDVLNQSLQIQIEPNQKKSKQVQFDPKQSICGSENLSQRSDSVHSVNSIKIEEFKQEEYKDYNIAEDVDKSLDESIQGIKAFAPSEVKRGGTIYVNAPSSNPTATYLNKLSQLSPADQATFEQNLMKLLQELEQENFERNLEFLRKHNNNYQNAAMDLFNY